MKTVLLSLSTLLAGAVVALPAMAQGPTDPQIAAIVVAANQVDIDAGRLAVSHAHDTQVKAFARQMITDHSAVNAAAVKLVTKLKVTPEPNATSKQLTDGGVANRKHLEGLNGAAFDKAYVDNEVAYHQAVIDALDKALIPNAQNAELKALLVQSRPAFVAHLEHARQVQGSLKK